jgi:beta-N-acetylhexosaminidase
VAGVRTAAALTAQQLAGQRVISSYPGLTPPQALFDDIRNGLTAGVIFFGENISSTSQIAAVVTQLRQAQAQSPISVPLLLMTDQEGGQVRRLPGAPTQSEKQIGQSSNPSSAASSAGTGAGNNLKGVGMNVNLAPVLDVFYKAGNFIDEFQRSYSHTPSVASACGKAFITAQQATGVAATAKHFPGLGSATTSQNTDAAPVTLNVTLNQLRTIDEVPYPAAVAAGVKLVMVSWAVYPALDASRPAGLSSTVIGQELRTRIGFKGVTITDAIEAGALSAYGTTGQRSVAAAGAGMDLILCSARDVTQGESAVSALAAAYTSGALDPTAFEAAANRVTALRASLF